MTDLSALSAAGDVLADVENALLTADAADLSALLAQELQPAKSIFLVRPQASKETLGHLGVGFGLQRFEILRCFQQIILL